MVCLFLIRKLENFVKKAVDSNGHEIGLFDGITVKDNSGKVTYWLSDDEVFAPTSYSDNDLQSFNKGQFTFIGKFSENKCLIDNEVIFKILE